MKLKNILIKQIGRFILALAPFGVYAQNNLIPSTQDCSGTRPPFDFEPSILWSAPGVGSMSTPLAGDIDGDGKVEILVSGILGDILVFDGATGTHVGTVPTGLLHYSSSGSANNRGNTNPWCIVDVEGDGYAEIFAVDVLSATPSATLWTVTSAHGVRPITFGIRWSTNLPADVRGGAQGSSYGNIPVVADLDGKGLPVFVTGRYIIKADGTMCPTRMNFNGSLGPTNGWGTGVSYVADLDGDGIPEIIVGTDVYKYDGNTATLWKRCPSIPEGREGTNVAADINLDGIVDLVYHDNAHTIAASMIVWTPLLAPDPALLVSPSTQGVIGSFPTISGNSAYPVVGDIDSIVAPDGKKYPEIGYNSSGNQFIVWSFDGTNFFQKFNMPTNESSGLATFTYFDFNLDGILELVYRDEQQLRVLNCIGSGNPITLFSMPAASGTLIETPIVADVTGDGSANIIVTGSEQLWVFEGAAAKWASCPPVWNQQMYSNLLINTDLTVITNVSSAAREDEDCHLDTIRLYNGGPMQAPYVSAESFCPIDLSPDVYIIDGTITMLSATSVQIDITVGNQGIALAASNIPIRYYLNNISSGTLISAANTTLGVNLLPGQSTVVSQTITGLSSWTALYVRLLDDGVNFPASGAFSDCNLTNNIKSFGTLELTKEIDQLSSCIGNIREFTVKLKNDGLTTANNIILTDSLSAGWTFISATPSAGTSISPFNAVTRSFTWTIPSLAKDDSAVLIIQAEVIASGSIRNYSWIESVDGIVVERDYKSAYVIASSYTAPPTPTLSPSGTYNICPPATDVLITASGSASSYQWYKNGVAILGANTDTYLADDDGEYSVTYFDGNCTSNMSDTLTVIVGGCIMPPDGTDFWFVAPQCDSLGTTTTTNFNRPVYFMITAGDLPAEVTMEMPAFPGGFNNRVISLAAGESQRIIFGEDYSTFSNSQMDTIENKIINVGYVGIKDFRGIHFIATSPVSIYYQIDSYNSKDMFALKGTKALGLEFYTPFQTFTLTNSSYPFAYPQFHVVATEDNTTVNITPSADIVGTNAGVVKTVTLQRGETFAARARNFMQTTRLAGSHIVANKPVAVTVTDDLLVGSGAADVTGDQIVPVNNLGTTYILVRGFTSANVADGDRVFILATQDNTTVTIDGVLVASSLSKGSQYVHQMVSDITSVIQTNYPVYVYQISGFGGEYGATLVPSMYSITSKRIAFYKNPAAFNHNIFVLVRDGFEGDFTINGSTTILQAGDFNNVPLMSGWKYARKDITLTAPSGTIVVNNNSSAFALGYFYTGSSGGASSSFGYLSPFGTLVFPDTTYMCNDSPIVLDAGYALSYDWTLPDGSHITNTSTITVSDTGMYSVEVNQDPFIVTASTHVLRRFEGSSIISSDPDDIGAGVYTYSANPGLYSDMHVGYTWLVYGVIVGSDPSFTVTWNEKDEKWISLVLQDTLMGCYKTHTIIHHKYPDNIIDDANCVVPPTATVWDIREVPMNKNVLTHNYGPLVAGDLFGDDTVRIVSFIPKNGNQNNYDSDGLRIFYMKNEQVVHLKDIPFNTGITHTTATFGSMAIARYAGTCYIVVCGVGGYLYAYNAETGQQIWQSSNLVASAAINGSLVNIVDFNGDGIPEVYTGNRIFSLATGALLCDGGANNQGALISAVGFFTTAADIDGDGLPELCAGNQIYKVFIPQGATTAGSGSMTVISDMQLSTLPPGAGADGATTVADIDNDGQLEVIVTTLVSSSVRVYVWKPLPNNASQLLGSYAVSAPNVSYYSIPMIGNIDDDPYPEIVFITNGSQNSINYFFIYALEYDPYAALGSRISEKWTLTHSDGSGCTGMSLFDFNLDGINEIVYRDETTLRIINGNVSTPSILQNFVNVRSGTLRELPIILDIDGDGQAEIIVQGWDNLTNVNVGGSGIDASTQNGYLRVFKSNGSKWAPARKVWNQYAYNAVNINEDLTVPRFQMNPATLFPGYDGTFGTPDDLRPYNGFLMQQTIINKNGEPMWLAPDATPVYSESYLSMTGNTMNISLRITNLGDAAIGTPVYIAMYKDNRATVDTIMTVAVPVQLNPGDSTTVTFTIPDVTLYQLNDSIIIRINDNGLTFPIQEECDTNNNEYIIPLMKKNAYLNGSLIAENGRYGNPVAVLFTDTIKYELTAVNSGNAPSMVFIVDTLPLYLKYVQNSINGGDSRWFDNTIIPPRLIWDITSLPAGASETVSFKATPEEGVSISQPMFINRAYVTLVLTTSYSTNETYHQGAGAGYVTFLKSLGGSIFNAEMQAVDYRMTPKSGIVIAPDEGYRFAGWSHDEYISLRGEKIPAQSGIMRYDTLTIYGHVTLRADFVPYDPQIKTGDETVNEQPTVEDTKIWAVGNELFIRTSIPNGIVRIYSIDGVLQKQQIILQAGETKIQLPDGIYVVTFNNGIGKKVIISE